MVSTSNAVNQIGLPVRVKRYNSPRSGLIHLPSDGNIVNLDFASLYICFDFHLSTLLNLSFHKDEIEVKLRAEHAHRCSCSSL